MTGLYRRRRAPAARGTRRGSYRGPRRTGRCPKSRSGWPVVAARREQAVGGGGERRRRRSGEGLVGRKGGRAARGRGEARCGVDLGGAAVEARLDGGLEARRRSVERRRRSGVWEHGESKRRRGIGCWGFCSAHARDREGRRALQRALHGGIAVAAARAALRSVGARGTTGGGTARWQGRRGVSGRCVEATRSRRWRGEVALHGGRAAHGSGGEQAGKQAGEEDRDPNEISKISGAYLKNIDNY